jgi:carboxymethylenebutenolidase
MNDVSGPAHPLARRAFVMTSLITGFTLATARVEAQAIHTDATGLEAGEIKIPVPDGEIPGYFARPQGAGPFPTILVIEEVYGVHEYIKDVCRRFAKLGYLAVAPELYARQGDLSKMTDMAQIMAVINRTPDAEINSDLDATVAWAGGNRGDASRLGINGFCRGGRVAWLYAAHSRSLKAAVSWYGLLSTPRTATQPEAATDLIGRLNCPVLGLYGARDSNAPAKLLQDAEAKARAAGKTVEIVVYPDAGHAFHADYRPSYNAADAADGWKRAIAWFRKYGVA